MSSTAARSVLRLAPFLSALLASPAPGVECGESVSGSISALGEVDAYTLQLAAGDVVGATIHDGTASPFEAVVALVDPGGQLVNLDGTQPFCGPTEACVSVPAPVSGTYTIQVADWPGDGSGSYVLTLETLSGGWNGGSNAPPTPACGAAADGTLAIGCGETASGAIDALGDSDTYTFLANAGDRIGLHGNVGLQLFAPGGVRVAFEGGSLGCAAYCASEPLPLTGVYTIRATHFVPGAYSFTLESLRESFAGASSVALCGATPIACNGTSTATIDALGDSDTFTFFGEAGDFPWLFPRRLVAGPVDFGPRVERFAPDGSRLAEANAPLPQTGSYTLRVSDGGSTPANAVGGYELSVVGVELGGEICPRFPELSCGETIAGSLPSGGGRHFYSFSAEAGDMLSLVKRTSPPLAPIGTLLIDPDGADAGPFTSQLEIASSGTHTVSISGGAGDYGLSLEALSGSFNGGSNTAPTPICGAVADGTRKIRCGETLAGAIDVVGDRDTYTFFAEAGDFVSAQVSPNGFSSPGSFHVAPVTYDASGLTVSFCGWGCTIQAIPSTGAYTLVVSAGDANHPTGPYTVSFTRTPCASDCNDGTDNDGDSLVDFGADGGCTSADDLSEAPECSDGLDNDGDGRFDFSGSDPGCAMPTSASEDPACDDGFDNDGDGTVDADGGGTGLSDASCSGVASQGSEASPIGFGCGLGPELLVLLPLLGALRRRRALRAH